MAFPSGISSNPESELERKFRELTGGKIKRITTGSVNLKWTAKGFFSAETAVVSGLTVANAVVALPEGVFGDVAVNANVGGTFKLVMASTEERAIGFEVKVYWIAVE